MDTYDIFLQNPDIKTKFPNLNKSNSAITSPNDIDYNCIAWAANFTDIWMWPTIDNPNVFWPKGVRDDLSVDSFIDAFAEYGYSPCGNGDFENGLVKVVLYVNNINEPTHMSRQLENEKMWTSKLGQSYDISHNTPEDLNGPAYGCAKYYFSKSNNNG